MGLKLEEKRPMASLSAFWYDYRVRTVVWFIIRAVVVLSVIATVAALF